MSAEGDVQIRPRSTHGARTLFIGILFAVAGFFAGQVKRDIPGKDIGIHPAGPILFLIGCVVVIVGVVQLADRNVKLSITSEGVRDFRNKCFVNWADFRGVRLYVETRNEITSAEMLVRMADDREISFNVSNLEVSREEIVGIVQRRGLAALESAAEAPETALSGLIQEVTRDLHEGIPLSFAVNKLVKRGLETDTAVELVALAAGREIFRCDHCNLDYHQAIQECTRCGGPLTRNEQGPT